MKVLVVIDVQNDFIDGALYNKEAIARIPDIVEEIKNFDGECIICTYDTHHENYLETMEGQRLPVPHCIQGTYGHKYNDEVQKALEESKAPKLAIYKETFGSNEWKKVFKMIQRRFDFKSDSELEIELIGFDIEFCVTANAFTIKSEVPNAHIMVKKSCCAGANEQNAENALKVMQVCHIDII